MITAPELHNAILGYRSAASPTERGIIYARDIAPRIARGEAIQATNTLGTVAGDLVVQRTLELLVDRIPVLTSISTNLSGEGGRLNQKVTVRTVTPPETKTYSPETGYASSDAATQDVDLTLDQHKHVQVEFNVEEMAGTGRDLFGEQAEAMFASLGDNLTAALFALITPANFPQATTCTASNFTRTTIIQMAKQLTGRKVPVARRFLLLGPDHYAAICEDGAIIALATLRREEILTKGDLPNIHGFLPYEVPSLPSTDNLAGFGAHPAALLLAVRPARDYSAAVPGVPSNGAISTVTEPRTGLSAAVVRFVDHKFGKAFLRVAWFYGVGIGIQAAGQRLVTL